MKTLTHEQEAFVQAYARIVAVASEEVVRIYFEMDDDDKFYETYQHEYTSITDAYLMWEAGRRYEAPTRGEST
jgi:hypothetical protein